MRALVLALALSGPALAQAPAEVSADSLEGVLEVGADGLGADGLGADGLDLVDPMLVGTWTLGEVAARGRLGAMGARVQAMTCVFEADGEGHVAMTLVQDLDTIEREREFDFETASGRIVTDSDDQPVAYQILDDGRLELRHPGGLTVHLERSAE